MSEMLFFFFNLRGNVGIDKLSELPSIVFHEQGKIRICMITSERYITDCIMNSRLYKYIIFLGVVVYALI